MSSADTSKVPTGLDQYTRAAEVSSNKIIEAYSTSFGWATKLLGRSVRQSVKNIYALVRVADEVVDGAAAEAAARGGAIDPAKALDELEAETYAALKNGFSTNLVVHAFAHTASGACPAGQSRGPCLNAVAQALSQIQPTVDDQGTQDQHAASEHIGCGDFAGQPPCQRDAKEDLQL